MNGQPIGLRGVLATRLRVTRKQRQVGRELRGHRYGPDIAVTLHYNGMERRPWCAAGSLDWDPEDLWDPDGAIGVAFELIALYDCPARTSWIAAAWDAVRVLARAHFDRALGPKPTRINADVIELHNYEGNPQWN